jgi:N-acetylglutamate synthase-like GNAT family acetyltransferase
MDVHRASTKDVNAVLFVINKSNSEAYRKIIPPKYFKEPVLKPKELLKEFGKMTFYVCKIENATIGIAALRLENERTGQLRWVYVLPEHQRKGAGLYLLEYIENEAVKGRLKKLRVLANDSADWAKNFYSKRGYKMIGKISRPWGNDAVYEKTL